MNGEEEEEISILDYARYFGLATDTSATFNFADQLATLEPSNNPSPLDDAHLPQLPLKEVEVKVGHLSVDRGAARLLKNARDAHLEPGEVWEDIAALCKPSRGKKLKLELPLLKTDPDADLKKFLGVARSKYKYEYGDLPPEPVDDENDEGLVWPTETQNLPKDTMKEIEKEKLVVTKETMLYLRDVLTDKWEEGAGDERELLEKAVPPRKVTWFQSLNSEDSTLTSSQKTTLRAITPPLSPIAVEEYEPFVPPSDDLMLPLLSDPPSLIGADLEAVDKKIFEKDSIVKKEPRPEKHAGDDEDEMVPSSDHFLDSVPSSEQWPLPERTRREDLKVEVPLTPLSVPPMAKKVHFSDNIDEMLLDHYYSDASSRTESAQSRNELEVFFDDELRKMLEDASATAMEKLNNEQLVEAATTKKVKVPEMDFKCQELPWKVFESCRSARDVLKQQRVIIAAQLAEGIPVAGGMRRLGDKLRWVPFPENLARVAMKEELGSEEDYLPFLTPKHAQGLPTIESLIYRSQCLKLLECGEGDEDEELGPAEFPPEQADLDSLVRRKRLRQPTKPPIGMGQTSIDGEPKRENGDPKTSLIDGLFSAENALDNFMELRGKKKPKLEKSTYFGAPNTTAAAVPAPIPTSNSTKPALPETRMNFPLPSINPPSTPSCFIISLEIMKIRPLIRAISALYPIATLIERDFAKYNKSAWQKGTVIRSPVISSLDAEADIILSPTTGVILTSFAKVKQKPLPGQKSQVAIRARIQAASKRYARMIVLISEGSLDETSRGLNGQDCMALTDFIGFCASLPTSTTATFVPGSVQALGHWLVSTMIQHGVQDGSQLGMLEDETVWELFLRRCGMNAYAAQAICGALRPPDGVDQNSPAVVGQYGLISFVRMSHQERVNRYGALLGGTAVLERVSTVVDTPWRTDTPVMDGSDTVMSDTDVLRGS